MRRHAKFLIALPVSLLIAASAAASLPNQSVEMKETPSFDRTAVETAENWTVQQSLDTLGFSIDLQSDEIANVTKQASLSQNLLFCAQVADGNCHFLRTGDPGFFDMYNTCYEWHFGNCLEELNRINEGIGGQ